MSIKIWEVEFSWNYTKLVVEADTAENAIIKAFKLFGQKPKSERWISAVKLLAETDE